MGVGNKMSKGGPTNVLKALLYDENGFASCPHCGSVLNADDERLASRYKANALLHCYIRELTKCWPADHDFKIWGGPQADREYHLRCYLTVFGAEHVIPEEVHHWETAQQYTMVLNKLERRCAFLRSHKRHGWVLPAEGGLTIKEAASIAIFGHDAIGWRAFCEVTEKIYAFATQESGFDLSDFKGDFDNMWDGSKEIHNGL